jgi:hypothetical protein
MARNPSPLTLTQPLDIDDARLASRRLADQRRAAEQELEKQAEKAADAEATYRKALALAFVKAEGATAAEREAQARAAVVNQSYQRDLAASLLKVQTERLRGLEGERSMLKSLIDWSARINQELREQIGRAA